MAKISELDQLPTGSVDESEHLPVLKAGRMWRMPLAAITAPAKAALAELFEKQAHPDVLWGVFTRVGRKALWMQARKSDGGPTDWTMAHLMRRLEELTGMVTKLLAVRFISAPGYLFSVVDARGRMTDLTARSSDGQVPEWVIIRWAQRIAAYLSPSANSLAPDMSCIVGVGSSFVANMETELRAMCATLGAAAGPAAPRYVNLARGGERSEHTNARMGAVPALLTVTGGVIPASGSVIVTISNMPVDTQFLASRGFLDGIAGTLSYVAPDYVFTRAIPGAATAIAANTPFRPAIGPAHRNKVALIGSGKNDVADGTEYPADTADNVIARDKALIDWFSPVTDRYLVFGMFGNTGWGAAITPRVKVNAINANRAATFKDRFLPVENYICGAQVWSDTGIAPTQADLDEQALGNLPASLAQDAGHLNAIGRQAYTNNVIKPRLIALGWYS